MTVGPEAMPERGSVRTGGLDGPQASPMPHDRVAGGDTLIILEAMKMELPVRAAAPGIVRAVHCREGDLVQPGAELIEIDEPDDAGVD